jgi:hypothetical protein
MRLGRDPRWRTLLAVSPDSDIAAPLWPRGIERLPQGNGDLNEDEHLPGACRLVLNHCRQRHSPSVRAMSPSSYSAMETQCSDGRRTEAIIGLHRTRLLALANVRWSARRRLPTRCAPEPVAFASTLGDVDSEEDYHRLRGSWQRLVPPR